MSQNPPSEQLFTEFPPVPTEAWEEQIREVLGADAEEKLTWDALEGVMLRAFYRAEDLPENLLHGASLQESPATNAWRLRQDISAPDLETAQRHLQKAKAGGASDLGLEVQPEDDRLRGIPIHRQKNFSYLLDGLDLTGTPLHLMGGRTALVLLALLLNEAERRGLPLDALRGSLDYDPIGGFAHGEVTNIDRELDRTAAMLSSAAKTLPHMRVLTVDACPYHEAGASAVQELAFTLAAVSEYLARLTERGLSVEAVLPRLHLVVPLGTSFFVTIGKLRALRRLYVLVAGTYLDQPATQNSELQTPNPFIQAVTSRREETVYDPHMNILRATTEATAAILGGCDVLAVRPFNAAFRSPGAFGQRLARNTQLILEHEAHLDRVIDPAAGSYYVENLTDQLARKAWALFQEVEARGGLLEALQEGFVQKEIARVRQERAAEMAERGRAQVGINHYPDLEENRLEKLEETPKGTPLERTDLEVSIDDTRPLEAMRRALQEGATLGDLLVAEPQAEAAIDPLPRFRPAEAFEKLRLRTERFARERGRRPLVFLLPIGPPAVRSARATFARNVFGCAGFAIDESLGFDTVEAGVHAALEKETDLIVLCSTDDAYEHLAREAGLILQREAPETLLIVAGNPKEHREELQAAGVDDFIRRGMNLLETLQAYQERLGMETSEFGIRNSEL